jgi:hypothetical protein
LKALLFLAVFLAAAVIVTVAFLTAAFIFWSFLSVQPGTVTALGTLFIAAPAAGIIAGMFTAARAIRPAQAPADRGSLWLWTTAAAVIGGLFGYGGSTAAIDLTHTALYTDASPAPFWHDAAPLVGGLVAALLLAAIVFAAGARRAP